MAIRVRVQELRKARGWSIAELARRSGLLAPAISRIEAHPRASVRFPTLEKLAAALGVDPPMLLAYEPEPPPKPPRKRRGR